jgi:hypothetical protein
MNRRVNRGQKSHSGEANQDHRLVAQSDQIDATGRNELLNVGRRQRRGLLSWPAMLPKDAAHGVISAGETVSIPPLSAYALAQWLKGAVSRPTYHG